MVLVVAVDHGKQLAKAAAALETAHAQRDQAIIDAAAAGMNQTAISRAVGMSRMQVYRIITGK